MKEKINNSNIEILLLIKDLMIDSRPSLTIRQRLIESGADPLNGRITGYNDPLSDYIRIVWEP